MPKIICVLIYLIFSISFADNFSEAIDAYDRQEYEEALRLFSELEKLGHIDAANNLATMYQTGTGTFKNYAKAAELYLKAAKAGHIDAAFNYSTLARLGIGIHKNMADAYAWSIVASRHGASDLVAYRDALVTKITPDEFEKGSKQAENILDTLSMYEYSIGWLLPNNVKITSRSVQLPTAIQKVEKLSSEGEITIIKSEDLVKITEENINEYRVPSYKAIFTTLPLRLNPYQSVIYRPFLNSSKYSSKDVLRPRRYLGERSVPIVESMEVDESLLPLFRSLSNSYRVHLNDIIRAVQALNPDVFEADLPLRLKDENTRLNIPNYSQIKSF